MKKFLALSISDVVFIMVINIKMPLIVDILASINVKMPTIVDILTFMSRIYFMLSRIEHEFFFITSVKDVMLIHVHIIQMNQIRRKLICIFL